MNGPATARYCFAAAALPALSCTQKGEVASLPDGAPEKAPSPATRSETHALSPEPVEFRPAPPEPVPEPVEAEGEVARYEGKLYFEIDVPEAVLADAPSLPDALPCAVRGGPAFQVYFVPPRETRTTPRRSAPASFFTPEEEKESRSLRERETELIRERTRHEGRKRVFPGLASDPEIPERTRASLRDRIANSETRVNDIQAELAEIRKAQSDVRRRPGARREKAPASAEAVEDVVEKQGGMIVGRLRAAGDVEIVLPVILAKARGQGLVATLAEPGDPNSRAKWIPDWASAREADLRASGDDAEYVDYALRHLERDAGREWLRGGPQRGEGAHVYDLFTGAAAIREALPTSPHS